jgi:putative CocE/NonD family hydrolase
MRGAALPDFLADRVVYYVLGANAWRSAPSVAAATARRETLLLSSPDSDAGAIARRGALAARAPAQTPDAYVYDPALPAHNEGFEGGEMVSANYLTDDGLMRRLDGDGLVYDTAPLAAPADLVGQPRATLSLAMDVPDTDIRVALYEVKPDGAVIFIAQDWVRARHRESNRTERLVTPGAVEPYAFETFPFVARTIGAGSVIRMVVAPLGASYHVQRNRNSGGVIADETNADNRVAHVRLHMGRQGSRIELPWGR